MLFVRGGVVKVYPFTEIVVCQVLRSKVWGLRSSVIEGREVVSLSALVSVALKR